MGSDLCVMRKIETFITILEFSKTFKPSNVQAVKRATHTDVGAGSATLLRREHEKSDVKI